MYELITTKDYSGELVSIVLRTNDDGSISWIPTDEGNSDYQAYLKSLEPEVVEEPVETPVEEAPVEETPVDAPVEEPVDEPVTE